MIWYVAQKAVEKLPYYFYVSVRKFKGDLVNSSGSRKLVFKIEIVGASPAMIHQALNVEVHNRFHNKIFDSGVVNTHMYAKHMIVSSEEAVVNVLATMYDMTAKVFKDTENETR
jgi:hypothetical protein